MSLHPDLKLAWCDHKAAKYAVEHWHYSKCLPAGKMNAVGVWEAGSYIGCVIFSYGANHNMAAQYGLTQQGCVELTRVALTAHVAPVTRIVSIAIKMIQRKNPGLELIVSYADPEQGHTGAIYRAGNWIYVGSSAGALKVWYKGRWAHKKTVDDAGVNQAGLKKKLAPPKYKYLYPLTDEMRTRIAPLKKPYPKKDTGASVVQIAEQPAFQPDKGGSIPTLTHPMIPISETGGTAT